MSKDRLNFSNNLFDESEVVEYRNVVKKEDNSNNNLSQKMNNKSYIPNTNANYRIKDDSVFDKLNIDYSVIDYNAASKQSYKKDNNLSN